MKGGGGPFWVKSYSSKLHFPGATFFSDHYNELNYDHKSSNFRIEDLEGNVIFDKILPSGTEIIVDSRSNELTRHGVPVMDENVGMSGSIVGRDIACSISIDKMERNIVEAKKSKVKREEAKERKKKKKMNANEGGAKMKLNDD